MKRNPSANFRLQNGCCFTRADAIGQAKARGLAAFALVAYKRDVWLGRYLKWFHKGLHSHARKYCISNEAGIKG